MTDMFLDALTATPSKSVARPVTHTAPSAHIIRDLKLERTEREIVRQPPPIAHHQTRIIRPLQASPVASNPEARPDYADEIDAMVRALETAGDIVFDGEAQAYRRPHYRRYRFTMGE